jgi:hypothetical protein
MVAHTYVGVNDQLVRIGWCELFRTATGELVAVPPIPAHTASEYLHATVDGDVVVVTVKQREPCRTDEEAPEIPIGEIGCQEQQPLRHFVPSSRLCWWPENATNGRRHKRHQLYTPKRNRAGGFALPVLQREVRLRTPTLRIRNGASAVLIR